MNKTQIKALATMLGLRAWLDRIKVEPVLSVILSMGRASEDVLAQIASIAPPDVEVARLLNDLSAPTFEPPTDGDPLTALVKRLHEIVGERAAQLLPEKMWLPSSFFAWPGGEKAAEGAANLDWFAGYLEDDADGGGTIIGLIEVGDQTGGLLRWRDLTEAQQVALVAAVGWGVFNDPWAAAAALVPAVRVEELADVEASDAVTVKPLFAVFHSGITEPVPVVRGGT